VATVIAILSALCAAMCFAVGSLLQQGAAREADERVLRLRLLLAPRGIGTLATWEPYAMIAAAVVGALFGQSAFEVGALALSLPVIDTLEPVSAVVIAAVVFGERLASSPALLGLQVVAGVMAIAGIALLSRSSIVAVETAGPPPPQASAGELAPGQQAR
jgi:drug/metabolite transporter (DMT)-like permease